MQLINNVILTTHTLTAILIVNISEVDVLVSEVVHLAKDEKDHNEMLKAVIGQIVIDSMQYNIPVNAYANILCSRLIDDYRIGITFNSKDSHTVNELITRIVEVVHTKMTILANSEKYSPVTAATGPVPLQGVFTVAGIDLINFRTIEFRFYHPTEG